jgi:hypothetical protein
VVFFAQICNLCVWILWFVIRENGEFLRLVPLFFFSPWQEAFGQEEGAKMASAVVLECTAVSGMMLMIAGQQSRVFATSSTTTTSSKQKMDLRCIQQQSLLSKLSLSNAEMIPVVWRRTDSRTRAVATSVSSSSSSSSPVAVASGAPPGMSILLTSNLQSKPIPHGLEAHAWAATLRGPGKTMKRLLIEEMPNVALINLRFLYMKELAFLL